MNKPKLEIVEQQQQAPAPPDALQLSPAEQEEAERFRQRTTQRAKRRAVVHRLIARLKELDARAKAA